MSNIINCAMGILSAVFSLSSLSRVASSTIAGFNTQGEELRQGPANYSAVPLIDR
jgi:hypothetical protein